MLAANRIDRVDSAMLEAIIRTTARDVASELDLPHVVHVFDRVLGLPTVLGPFPSPMSAAMFAERYVREACGFGDVATLRADVIPLEPVDLA